jgi:class 3 adenylate cyclase/CheY-like chemotaxis protein
MLSTDLAVVTERLKAVQLGQTGAAFVIDAQGKVLAHPEAKYAAELKDFSTHPAVRALLTGQPGAFTFTDNHDVNWLSHSIALENGWGVIVQQQKREILENVRFFWRFATLVVLTVSLMVGVLTWIIATHLVRPLEKLTQAAVAGAEGNLNQTITFQRNDEIGILVKAFNQMAAQLKASFETLATNNQELQRLQTEALRLVRAYERFVPREFLNLLGKQSIVDIQLGDQVEQEMTVLFSDIRGFTSLSEKMTPHETFEFINNYLGQMEPIIFEYHGVIDKYMGDAIMAVFPAANDAVSGAITMLKTLATYNQLLQITQFPPLHIGIGLNTGRLMLGTVGGKQRMEGTVIADAVNLASRVEELTKIYQTPLLITEHTYRQLEDPMQYHIRVVDVVKVKGKLEEVTVYEVYDADSPESIVLKDDTREDLELGFVLYHSSEFADAQPFFEKVWQVNPTDQVAQIYLNRCQEILSLTMPEKSTILVVDDMPVNVEILSLILTANHFEVLVAHDGESALAMVESHLPQLILLDVMMPGIDGFETCQRLKMQARTKNIPVIFMTVLTDQQNKLKGFEAGAVDYITKPFYKEEVLARIRVHLSNHYLRQQLLERM